MARAHTRSCAGGRLLLLFDWALPLLGPAGSQLGWASQYWVLLALAQGLALCDPPTLAQQAGPVMAACTALLEAEGTSPHLLAPLLGVVQQVRPLPVPVLTGCGAAFWTVARVASLDVLRSCGGGQMHALVQAWLAVWLLVALVVDASEVSARGVGLHDAHACSWHAGSKGSADHQHLSARSH